MESSLARIHWRTLTSILRRARCFQVAFAFERESEGDPSLEDFPLIPEETSTAEDPFSLFEVKMKVWGEASFRFVFLAPGRERE